MLVVPRVGATPSAGPQGIARCGDMGCGMSQRWGAPGILSPLGAAEAPSPKPRLHRKHLGGAALPEGGN